MLKRMEIYVDAALLSFPIALALFFVTIAMPGIREFLQKASIGAASVDLMYPIAAVAGILAVMLARVLHHRTDQEPLTKGQAINTSWIALGTVVLAALLAAQVFGAVTAWSWAWMILAVLLLALAVALIVDSVMDLVKPRIHRTIDILRIVFLLPLGASLLMSLIQPAEAGSDQDVAPWLFGVTAYMLMVALGSFVYDELMSWRGRSRGAHDRFAVSA